MALFASPSAQWPEVPAAAPVLTAAALVLGAGIYTLQDSGVANGFFEDDGTGTLRIVASSAAPKATVHIVPGDNYVIY